MDSPIHFLGFTTSLLELVSFALSIVMVALNIRQIHWAWLFSILASALYAGVFFLAKLYGDMALQFVFIAASVWGWMQWLRGDAQRAQLPVTQLDMRSRLAAGGLWGVLFLLCTWFLARFTDSDVPQADGFLTAGSLLGQLLLSRKKIENWHVWIAVDVLYVGLYLYKNLMLTALLYAVFVAMAVAGLRTWRKEWQM